jgi:aryl-alcohol dehydrogenase-like predicted oxidoreductase
MQYRNLGASGLKIPVLSFGCATFGGEGPFFSAWGSSDVEDAKRLIDICIEAGANLFDTADAYSGGASEKILGAAIKGRRDEVLIATKMTLPLGAGPNDAGSSRHRIVKAVENALQRLDTDYIDILQMHAFDSHTPVEEVLYTVDTLVRAGKVRYLGASNYAGWELMKSLSVSERHGWPRYVGHQVHYSLVGRDYEWELMPLAADQDVGAIVWSPLGWGRLTGKIRRGQAVPEGTRLHDVAKWGLPVDQELLYRVVDALDVVAAETGKSIPQIALAWLLARPTVSSVIIGARNEAQLRDNLGAVGWSLSADQIKRLDEASAVTPHYPHYAYHVDRAFRRLSKKLV